MKKPDLSNYTKKLAQVKSKYLDYLGAFEYFHPRSAKILTFLLNTLSTILIIGAILSLFNLLGILPVPREVMKLLLKLLIIVSILLLLGGVYYIWHALVFFNKSYTSENSFSILQYQPFQFGYDYIDVVLPKLEKICGKMTVRASYTYSGNFGDGPAPVSAGYHGTWENRPDKRIMRVAFESTENSSERRLIMYYKRVPINIYSLLFVDGEGFGQVDRERIIDVINNEQWRLKPKYSFLINLRLGFTFLMYLIVGEVAAHILWDNLFSITAILTMLVLNLVILMLLLILLWLKSLLFPSGTFYIDQEVKEIEDRERIQKKIFGLIERYFWFSLS